MCVYTSHFSSLFCAQIQHTISSLAKRSIIYRYLRALYVFILAIQFKLNASCVVIIFFYLSCFTCYCEYVFYDSDFQFQLMAIFFVFCIARAHTQRRTLTQHTQCTMRYYSCHWSKFEAFVRFFSLGLFVQIKIKFKIDWMIQSKSTFLSTILLCDESFLPQPIFFHLLNQIFFSDMRRKNTNRMEISEYFMNIFYMGYWLKFAAKFKFRFWHKFQQLQPEYNIECILISTTISSSEFASFYFFSSVCARACVSHEIKWK